MLQSMEIEYASNNSSLQASTVTGAFYHCSVGRYISVFLQHAVLAITIPSVRLSVTRRYCVKMTAHSTVQFALSYSKMCLVL